MKRIFLLLALTLSGLQLWADQAPKYVFYFIGDGMGVNQVNGTETYLSALEGRIGIRPLTFASFPNVALVTTQSHSNGITDSAAAGTAMATGRKTYNNAIGLLPDSITPATSVAVWAKTAGAAVGVATSVSVDHATPAAFYAHQKHRKMYHEIGRELPASGFDFFAGSDFLKPEPATPGEDDLYTQARKAGYTIARGYKDFLTRRKKADRMILLQTEEASRRDRSSLPFAIDRQKDDLTLTDITRSAIQFLTQKNPDRFFCMIEGGKIDWACHNHDGATVFHEIIDFDDAVRVAYEFYRNHPDETLIVVTADHETGGITLGNSNYTLHTELLRHQRMSSTAYTAHLALLEQKAGGHLSYERLRRDLTEQFGFGREVKLSREQEAEIRRTYEQTFTGEAKARESLYAAEHPIAALAKEILNHNAKLGWTTGSHTHGYVPLFAIGAGADAFHGRIDNTDIPNTIAKVAGYALPSKPYAQQEQTSPDEPAKRN